MSTNRNNSATVIKNAYTKRRIACGLFMQILLLLFAKQLVTAATAPKPSYVSTVSPTLNSINTSVYSLDLSRPVPVKIFAVKQRKRINKSASTARKDSMKVVETPISCQIQSSRCPSRFVTASPSRPPTLKPSQGLTKAPTSSPSKSLVSSLPTVLSSKAPLTRSPTSKATICKPTSLMPSIYSTPSPLSSMIPTSDEGSNNVRYRYRPTKTPSATPSMNPTQFPSRSPIRSNPPTTIKPTISPSTNTPSRKPVSKRPTTRPSSIAAPSAKPSKISPADDIQYRGGLVFTENVKIFNIFYGNFSGEGSQTVALTNYLAANLGNSSWYNILSSYYRIVNGRKIYVDGSLRFAGSYNLFPNLGRISTTVAEIKENIATYIFEKGVVKPDPYTIYAIIFRGDLDVSNSAGSWLIDWCGLNTGVYFNQDSNIYPVFMIGDLSTANTELQYLCSVNSPFPNGIAADSVANSYAHELVEIVTNPLPARLGWSFDPAPNRSSSPWNNADECTWQFSDSFVRVGAKNYSLQKNWQPGMQVETSLSSLAVLLMHMLIHTYY